VEWRRAGGRRAAVLAGNRYRPCMSRAVPGQGEIPPSPPGEFEKGSTAILAEPGLQPRRVIPVGSRSSATTSGAPFSIIDWLVSSTDGVILKSTLPLLAVVASLSALATSNAQAQPGVPNEYAKIVAHIVPVTTSQPCGSSKATVKCEDMVVRGDLISSGEYYYLYIVATDGDPRSGFGGVQFGISYNSATRQGVDVFSWTLCGTLEFAMTGWPAANTGTLITWDTSNCQNDEPNGAGTGVMAVAGYFYVGAYSPDQFKVTVRPNDGEAKVADCQAFEAKVEGPLVHFSQSHLGYVSFSAGAETEGYNPCGMAKPTEEKTWSQVKSNDR
jgi:hypothetical protein